MIHSVDRRRISAHDVISEAAVTGLAAEAAVTVPAVAVSASAEAAVASAADRPTISAETSGLTLEVASADAVVSDRVAGPLDPQDGVVQDLMDLVAGMDLWMDLHPHGCKDQVSFLIY